MKIFLDTAIYEEIEQGVNWGVLDGVTTNPTLIAKAGQDHETEVKRICGIIGNVSAEVVSEKKDDIVVEGERDLVEFDGGRVLCHCLSLASEIQSPRGRRPTTAIHC